MDLCANVCKSSFFFSSVLGLTALHMAVLTHNAVVQDLSRVAAPQSPQTAALMQKRKLLGECINTLLLMGASYGTKVSAAISVLYYSFLKKNPVLY